LGSPPTSRKAKASQASAHAWPRWCWRKAGAGARRKPMAPDAERCEHGSAAHASGDGYRVVRAGAPPLGVRLPTQVGSRLTPDRAPVEGLAVVGIQGAALRHVGQGLSSGGGRDPVLERPAASLHLGPAAPPSTPPPPGYWAAPKSRLNLP